LVNFTNLSNKKVAGANIIVQI